MWKASRRDTAWGRGASTMILEHADVEAGDVIGRYRTGRLSAQEAQAFEEHYLECARCLDDLEADDALRGAMRGAAAQDATVLARPLALVAWLARLGRSRQAGVLAGALVVVLVLPLVWQQRRLADLTRERDTARAAAELTGRAARPAASTDREPKPGPDERARLVHDLEHERRARAAAEERLERALQPQANTPIVRLSPLRSLGGAPADRWTVHPGAAWVVLALELPAADYPSYRVHVTRAGDQRQAVWSHAGLVADAEGTLTFAVHASSLPPGDYEAAVEGLDPGGKATPLGRYTLRVVAAPR